jgi:hypothetical protein
MQDSKYKKLESIDDLRSIGQTFLQVDHLLEILDKSLSFPEKISESQKEWIQNKIYNLNNIRRQKMAMFFNKYAKNKKIELDDGNFLELNEKGWDDVYCLTKHAIADWAYASEKLAGTNPFNEDYKDVLNVFDSTYTNMLDIVAKWLGVTELVHCADCLSDRLVENSEDK